jgi:hypothetical protein
MKVARFTRQDLVDITAWVVAAFLVLALVNGLRGTAPPQLPPNPQLVRQPAPDRLDATTDGRSAHVSKTRRE